MNTPVVTLEEFNELVSAVTALVETDDSFTPNAILALSTGGFPVAAALAKRLDISSRHVVGVAAYKDETGDYHLDDTLVQLQKCKSRTFLVVDDASNRGLLTKKAVQAIEELGGRARSCVLIAWEGGEQPDYVGTTCPGEPPKFFWEPVATNTSPDVPRLTGSPLQLDTANGPLAAQLFSPNGPTGHGVLFIHGWRSDMSSPELLAQALRQIGVTVLTFDLRGHGSSPGNLDTLTRQDFLDDCIAAYDTLAAFPDVQSISIVGSSFGGYLACLLTSVRPVQTLVLRAPANYSDETFSVPQLVTSDALDREGTRLSQTFDDTRSLHCLQNFLGRVLLVVSGRDEIVSADATNAYANAARAQGTLRTERFDDAGHNFDTVTKQRYSQLLVDWFKSEVTGADR